VNPTKDGEDLAETRPSPIRNFDQMVEHVKSSIKTPSIAIAAGHDRNCVEASLRAIEATGCEITIVGDSRRIDEVCAEHDLDRGRFEVLDEPDDMRAGQRAVEMIRTGRAKALMKGALSTDKYMKCILDKEKGLLPKGGLLTHLSVMQLPAYHKLLFLSDVAIVPHPTLEQKGKIMTYAAEAAKRFGIEHPKVALLAASEKVSERMPATMEAAVLSKMAERGQIASGALVDGPLALDVAISKEAVEIKGLQSVVAGDADVLIFPNIETGNVFYKSLTAFTEVRVGAVVAGATAPCVLTSRADSDDNKFISMVLSSILG
jgi:phosphotransacetylase